MTSFLPPLPDLEPGSVWLAGAGPGDPGLLSLLALKGLRQADAILHDALVSPEILDLAGPGAVLEDVGKRAGRRGPAQAAVSRRMVELARGGLRVLRLKGGDPCVFGRGGEEGLALAEAGVPFRLIPGITAGIGGLAYAGIPATHRDCNHSLTLVAGHDARGAFQEGVDWGALSRGASVLVLYMALGCLAQAAQALMAAGRSPEEPAAVVSQATTPRQETVVSTLGAVASEAAAAGLGTPALLVVGEVVRLRERLGWFPEALRAGRETP